MVTTEDQSCVKEAITTQVVPVYHPHFSKDGDLSKNDTNDSIRFHNMLQRLGAEALHSFRKAKMNIPLLNN